MSLIESTQQELEALARKMLAEGSNSAKYEKFGILVKKDTPEYTERSAKDTVVFGEVQVDDIAFVYFAD